MANVQQTLVQREKWLTALEGDNWRQDWRQCRNDFYVEMRVPNGFTYAYCAIGLAAHLASISLSSETLVNMRAIIELTYGLTTDGFDKIICLNDDDEYTFKQIAAYVRNNPGTFWNE
jgi:hypothetical protein